MSLYTEKQIDEALYDASSRALKALELSRGALNLVDNIRMNTDLWSEKVRAFAKDLKQVQIGLGESVELLRKVIAASSIK